MPSIRAPHCSIHILIDTANTPDTQIITNPVSFPPEELITLLRQCADQLEATLAPPVARQDPPIVAEDAAPLAHSPTRKTAPAR